MLQMNQRCIRDDKLNIPDQVIVEPPVQPKKYIDYCCTDPLLNTTELTPVSAQVPPEDSLCLT